MAKRFDYKVDLTQAIRWFLIGSLMLLFFFFNVVRKTPQSIAIEASHNFANDTSIEKVILDDKHLKVLQGNITLFETDPSYEISDFEIGDINNDGEDELIIGYFRKGDYGKNLPYIELRRDPKMGYHLSLYKYSSQTNSFKLLWGSSTLPHPIFDFEIELRDEKYVLKVVQGSYNDYDRTGKVQAGQEYYWIWNEWWFEKLEK